METNTITFGEAILALGQVVLFASFLALVTERVTELFVVPALERIGAGYAWLAAYMTAVLGIIVALSFGIDLMSPIAEALGLAVAFPIAGQVFTGLVIGGGSNLLHDIWPGRVNDK